MTNPVRVNPAGFVIIEKVLLDVSRLNPVGFASESVPPESSLGNELFCYAIILRRSRSFSSFVFLPCFRRSISQPPRIRPDPPAQFIWLQNSSIWCRYRLFLHSARVSSSMWCSAAFRFGLVSGSRRAVQSGDLPCEEFFRSAAFYAVVMPRS